MRHCNSATAKWHPSTLQLVADGGALPFTWCDNEGGGCYTEPTYTTEIYTP